MIHEKFYLFCAESLRSNVHFPCSRHLSPKLPTVLCPTALCGCGRHIGWCHSGLPPCPTGTRQKSGTHYVCSGPSGKSNEKKQGHPVLGADQREGLSSAWLPQTPPRPLPECELSEGRCWPCGINRGSWARTGHKTLHPELESSRALCSP